MTKNQYAKCEEYSKKLKELPEFETLVKASQLMSDGSYWGPEAEATMSPSDINIDALKIQMKLFLKQYGNDVDLENLSSDSFKDLVDKVMNEKIQNQNSNPNAPSGVESVESNETIVTSFDDLE